MKVDDGGTSPHSCNAFPKIFHELLQLSQQKEIKVIYVSMYTYFTAELIFVTHFLSVNVENLISKLNQLFLNIIRSDSIN